MDYLRWKAAETSQSIDKCWQDFRLLLSYFVLLDPFLIKDIIHITWGLWFHSGGQKDITFTVSDHTSWWVSGSNSIISLSCVSTGILEIFLCIRENIVSLLPINITNYTISFSIHAVFYIELLSRHNSNITFLKASYSLPLTVFQK